MTYPPKGKEKNALLIIQRVGREIDRLGSDLESLCSGLPWNDDSLDDDIDWLITPAHALEGVRTNEREQTTTLAAFAVNVRRLRLRSRQLDDVVTQLKNALRNIIKVCSAFKVCTSCKGRRGEWEGEPRKPDSYWDDCQRCKGRGILEVEKVQLLKEYDTYLPSEQ